MYLYYTSNKLFEFRYIKFITSLKCLKVAARKAVTILKTRQRPGLPIRALPWTRWGPKAVPRPIAEFRPP